ncbi:hypothetical protein Dsin_001291 [Dipteronia sinensis]|uniref:RFTS domain-containing protein n=1 Tax=Dipteronia sinensis TaxID=43782 RepID=A0AAE0B4Z0_9ROSI|nr:hypothetical protein Dsin_001291 [Dipteronia sinensis]
MMKALLSFGSPLSTDVADYDCVRPGSNYKMLYNLFFGKARACACVEVYKMLSKTCGGKVIRSMSDSKSFPDRKAIKDFIISQGGFIYNQLIGLDETSLVFKDLPVLAALREENDVTAEATASGNLMNTGLRIGEGEQISQSSSSACRNR